MNVISDWEGEWSATTAMKAYTISQTQTLPSPIASPLPYSRHHAGLPSSPRGKQGEKPVTGTILEVACPQSASYIVSKYLI